MKIIKYLIIIMFGFLNSTLWGQSANLVLNQYSGQQEISATQSIRLTDGFHATNGSNVRIFINRTPFISSVPSNEHYVLTRIFNKAGVTTQNINESRYVGDENQSIQYFDSFGRKIQTIDIASSTDFQDIIKPEEYDNSGLVSKGFLPYVSNASQGAFNPLAKSDQENFYQNSSWVTNKVAQNNFPYAVGKSHIDIVPNIYEQGAVGNDWQPSGVGAALGDNNTNRVSTVFNNTIEVTNTLETRCVNRFKVDPSNLLVVDGVYGVNSLYVTVVKNENWKSGDGRNGTTEQYKDKSGKIILSRTFQIVESALQMYSTYFVYDDSDRLAFQLAPGAFPDQGVPSQSVLNKLCYQYKYDDRNRLIEEKNPDLAPIYYVYNKLDQLVARQDPKKRLSGEWSISKYDIKGRNILNGVWKSSTLISREEVQADVDTKSTYWESRISTSNGYSNNAWPTVGINTYASVSYFDNYEVPDLPTNLAYVPNANKPKFDYPTGLPTANKVWDENNNFSWSVSYYDQELNLVQSQASNHLGGRDMVNNFYSFIGQIEKVERKHFNSSEQLLLTVTNTNKYDHVGRLLEVKQKLNSQDEITLVSLAYNAIGQLVDKKVHKKSGQSKFLQSIDYRYNERGWLKSINDPDLLPISAKNDGDSDSNFDLFGMELLYNEDANAPQFNGNIASFSWKTSQLPSQQQAPPKMGYQFRYDPLNRMKQAISEKNGNVDNAHNEDVGYDINGNILHLQRKAYTGGNIATIDDLAYTYDGYRAKKIDDQSNSAFSNLGFKELVKTSEEYLYDANGNMKEDKNKGITVVYNSRNLVSKVTFGGDVNHKLEFLYDRGGKKLRATYTYPNGVYTIDYLDGIQYQQGQIAFLHTREGRARWNGSKYIYEYDLKDHLGNVRVVFKPIPTDNSETTVQVTQQNSYYPYGLPMYGDSDNGLHLAFVSGEKSKYLYSGKELYDQGGLDWFDHGSRMYDPAIGRWSVMDPATQFANPYLAMGNNPVVGVDPNGEFFVPILVGAAVGVLANGISNTTKNQAFFKGWGMAAAMGAVGGYMAGASAVGSMSVTTIGGASGYTMSMAVPATVGQQALAAGMSVASSYLPGMNIPIGDIGSLSLNPSFTFGGGGFQIGGNAGISMPWAGGFSIGLGGGSSWGRDGFTGNKGWTSSFTGAIGYTDGTNSFSLSTTKFNSPGIRSQNLGTFSYQHKSGIGVGYSNDGAPFDKFSFANPGSDGFRSAALQLSYKNLTIGTRIFTGDRNVNVDQPDALPGYPRGVVGNEDAYSYMSSLLFVSYNGLRAGFDDWRVGQAVQNKLAHDILKPQVWFRWREYGQNMKLYGGYFSSNNPFILW